MVIDHPSTVNRQPSPANRQPPTTNRQPPTVMITIKRVTDFSELEGIRKLQEDNLKRNLSGNEAETEGFVTAEYTIEFLETLHKAAPSIIAKDDDQVVGFALVATKSVRHQHELLSDLFNSIDHISFNDISLKEARYVVVGQLCVAKNYRGRGLVQQMYRQYKNSLSGEYDYCITDVAENNPRSLRVHLNSGFQVVDTIPYGGLKWNIVLWDWNSELEINK
jgi:ribosomal protein S18 acetylase RimI-like enzyme